MASSSDSRDNYDMHQSLEAWNSFLKLSKWIIIFVIILLAWMAAFLTGGNPPPVGGAH